LLSDRAPGVSWSSSSSSSSSSNEEVSLSSLICCVLAADARFLEPDVFAGAISVYLHSRFPIAHPSNTASVKCPNLHRSKGGRAYARKLDESRHTVKCQLTCRPYARMVKNSCLPLLFFACT